MSHPHVVAADVTAVALGLVSYSGVFHEWVSTIAGLLSITWIVVQILIYLRGHD